MQKSKKNLGILLLKSHFVLILVPLGMSLTIK